MRTTIATLFTLATLASLPAAASAGPLPSTCDILKNTGCDLQPPSQVCVYAPGTDHELFCVRPND